MRWHPPRRASIITFTPRILKTPATVRLRHNPPLERTAAAVYFTCRRASRVCRRGR